MEIDVEDPVTEFEATRAPRDAAIAYLREAVEVLAKSQRLGLADQRFLGHDLRGELIGLLDEFVLPSFLGAPGDPCDYCRGTGRKPT